MDTVTILLSSFILSVTGLLVFIWSLRHRLFNPTSAAANVIFSPGEIGHGEEPAASPEQRAGLALPVAGQDRRAPSASEQAAMQQELAERVEADRSSAFVTFVFLSCSVVSMATVAVARPWIWAVVMATICSVVRAAICSSRRDASCVVERAAISRVSRLAMWLVFRACSAAVPSGAMLLRARICSEVVSHS